MKDVMFSLIEIFISLIVETIILGGVFTFISNKNQQQAEQKLESEIKKIESQNKLIYQEITRQNKDNRDDILSQIKESSGGQKC
jgi:Tfp pilus assembly protein PilV